MKLPFESKMYKKSKDFGCIPADTKFCCKAFEEAVMGLSFGDTPKDGEIFPCGNVEYDSDDHDLYFDNSGHEYGSHLHNVKFCPFCGERIEITE